MRAVLTAAGVFYVAALALAQPPKVPTRYQIQADFANYPQDTPKAALTSVIAALDRRRLDYLLAHLAEPKFVDARVAALGGQFDEFVKELETKLGDDPDTLRFLIQLERTGEWQEGETTASVRIAGLKDRQAFFRQVGGRWFMENRRTSDKAPPPKPINKDQDQ